MLTLRKGGEFADRQIRRIGKTAVWYFIGFAAICAVFFLVSYKIVALLGIVFAFHYLTTAYDKWEHWFLGKRGELAVTRALSALPDGYVLLNDLLLPNGGGNVDHFLVGPNGLFVIETKNYDGNVKCEGDKWFVNGKPAKSFSRQAKRNALAVRNCLADVFAEHNVRLPYVEAIVAFAKHRHRLEINEATVNVLRAEDLLNFVEDYERRSRVTRFTPDLRRAMVHHLQSLQNQKTVRLDKAKPPNHLRTAQF